MVFQHGQAAQKRIKSLNQQLLASQIQLARKDEHIKQVKLEKQQVEEQVQDLQQSLDNNQGIITGMLYSLAVVNSILFYCMSRTS